MKELSTPAKSVLMATATLVIGFSTLVACRGSDPLANSKMIARGDTSLAYSALAYITWPKESFDAEDSPFVIGVLGKPTAPHEKLLASYADGKKQIHGRSVRVRSFSTTNEITESHVLLVPETCPREEVDEALKTVHGKSVLTIGETGQFAQSGGVLGVVRDGDDSILALNQRAAKRQKLKVDVRLLNVSVLAEEKRSP